MTTFGYVSATGLADAIRLLNEPGVRSRVLAGGTDILVQIRNEPIQFDRLVDVSRIPELKVIQMAERVTVGAGVTFTEILASPLIQMHAPLLIEACKDIGSTQIRNLATIGGNVANAAAAADSVPALVCLGAEAVVVTAAGEQRLGVADLIPRVHRPKLPPGSLIRAFEFDVPPAGSRMAFERIVRRRANAIARLSLAALAVLSADGTITEMRLAPGATFAHFQRASAVEALLLGQQPSAALFRAAGQRMAELFVAESGRRWSVEYKEKVLPAVIERALRRVVGEPDAD